MVLVSPLIRRVLAPAIAVLLIGASALFFAPDRAAANVDDALEQQWIVVLRDDVADVPTFASILSTAFGGDLELVYEHALKGFLVTMTELEARLLEQSSWVDWVEPDVTMSITSQVPATGVTRVGALANSELAIDGVDGERVDVDVAVLDTGVDLDHPDLNVVGGVDCTMVTDAGSLDDLGGGTLPGGMPGCAIGGDDVHVHGTHVAGIIGALDNEFGVVGVAPGARIHSVRVLDADGTGTTSSVLAGIDWVAEHADTIEVANLSLVGAGYSAAQYEAIQRAVDRGVAFSVAAGNSARPAYLYSPAGFDNVLTVSAMADYDGLPGGLAAGSCRSEGDDRTAPFSNNGPEVRIAAPGICIESTIPMGHGGYGVLSGTSMAAPHVAGGLAILAAGARPTNAAEVDALYQMVIDAGSYDWTDIANDGWFEPLLDVSRFSPTTGRAAPQDSAPGSGDVNCDQATTIADALVIAQYASGIRTESGSCAMGDPGAALFTGAGDLDGDLSVTIVDALLVARCVVGIDYCDWPSNGEY